MTFFFPNTDNLIRALLEGKQLSLVSRRRKTKDAPMVTESRPLVHIIEKKDAFWGLSQEESMPHTGIRGTLPFVQLFFCATNVKELFGQWYDAQKVLQLLPSYRYESFSFELSSRWIPLWDSQKGEAGISEVVRAIDEGRVLRVAMLDAEDVWNFHPVSLATYNETEEFEVHTACIAYPFFFRSPEELTDIMRKSNVAFPRTFQEYKGESLSWKQMQTWPSFYALSSKGTYYNAFDIPRGTSQSYKRMVLFSS